MDNTGGRKISVLAISSVYPRHDGDLEVPWLRISVRELINRGCDVSVVAPSYRGLRDHTIDGVRIHRFRYAPKRLETLTHDEGAPSKIARNPLLQLLAIPYVISGTIRTLRLTMKLKPDVIHVHWPFPHAFMALAARFFCRGVKVALTFYSAELLLAKKKKWIRPLLRSFIKRADRVIAISTFAAETVRKIYDREIETLPYGSTLDGVSGMRARRVDSGKFRILFVGRHIERKGIEYLIKAAALLDADKFQTRIVGHGDRTGALKELAKKIAPRQVVFTGKISNEELEKEYESAGCFVLPAIIDSRGDTEGLGVVMIEAAEYGVPVVASGLGGITDVIINDKTGLLVKEKSPEELAAAIRRLYDDADLREKLATNCRKHVHEFFSWDRIACRQAELYRALVLTPQNKKNRVAY